MGPKRCNDQFVSSTWRLSCMRPPQNSPVPSSFHSRKRAHTKARPTTPWGQTGSGERTTLDSMPRARAASVPDRNSRRTVPVSRSTCTTALVLGGSFLSESDGTSTSVDSALVCQAKSLGRFGLTFMLLKKRVEHPTPNYSRVLTPDSQPPTKSFSSINFLVVGPNNSGWPGEHAPSPPGIPTAVRVR